MVDKEEYFMIHTLHKQGYSQRAIERMTGISRKTISKYLKEENYPERNPYPERDSKLNPYKSYIKERIATALPYKIPATVIMREIQAMGYTGGITILRTYLTSIRPAPLPEKLVRFETSPGHQMQVDFASVKGSNGKLHIFVAELGYSRRSYTEFIENERLETFIQCHINAFEYFGGVPHEILYDNAKVVVIERNYYGKGRHKFQDLLLDMCRHYGCMPKLCKPYRAKTKGKVERFIHYVKHSFYYPEYTRLKMNGLSMDKETANIRVNHWAETVADRRIHGTTGRRPIDMFKEEKPLLIPLSPAYKGAYPVRALEAAQEEKPHAFVIPDVNVQTSSLEQYDHLIPAGDVL